MILSKISCHGFKSFAKKLELKFDGRITAIVGPNGCGKTNVVDAIRWGLGEQRPSVLRAERMESIIFGGARSAKPLGMAEVSVHFDNSAHLIPIDYTEIVVTRRLYRSGESEYILNRNTVRLKDIQDLLMDTGIGADAYSVIELKMVEDILSDKAEDRRRLLEEAAGVTKYKHRLKAAMHKLDVTRTDLLRVNDIIVEVDRSVNSLKRQVQRAQRYQVIFEELKDLELRRGKKLLSTLELRMKPLRADLSALQQQKEGRTTTITKEEADLEALRLEMVEKEKSLSEIRERLGQTIERIHRKEGDIRVGKERITALHDRILRNTQEIANLKARSEEQKVHIDRSIRERETLQVKITSTNRIFTNKQKELEVFNQGLNLKRLDLNAKKKEIIECLEGIHQLSGEETQRRAKIDNSQGRLDRLDEEDTEFRESQKQGQSRQGVLDGTLRDLRSRHGKLVQAQEALSHDARHLAEQAEDTKEQLFKEQSELELHQGRLQFLKNIVESREGMTDGARTILSEKIEGLNGVLADLLKSGPAYRTVIEAGLGEAARYLVFDKISQGIGAVRMLRNMGGGRVALISLDRVDKLSGTAGHPPVPRGVEAVGWGDELVECQKYLKPVVSYLLGDLLVVKDLEEAQNALEKMDGGGFRIGTMDGEILSGWGILQTSESGGRDTGMVGRKQRMEELEKEIAKRGKTIENNKNKMSKTEDKRKETQEKLAENEKAIKSLEEDLRNSERQEERVHFEAEKAKEGLDRNSEERQKLLEGIEKEKDTLEDLRPRMEALVERREKVELTSNVIQAEVDRLEEEGAGKEEEVHRFNLTLVRLKGDAKNLDYDIERSQSLIKEIEESQTRLTGEVETAKTQIVQYQEETSQNEASLVDEYKMKEEQDKVLGERENDYQNCMETVRERERQVREVRKSRDETSERIHSMEMEVSELEHQGRSLRDRLIEVYEIDVAAYMPSEQKEINLDESEIKIEDLKRKIKNLGPVSMEALEEYNRESERLTFLIQQRDDLLSAEATLKETIKRINQTARDRFIEVFGKVRQNFQETFKRFFQGGEADLRLPEGEDPLEAPVDITARPAGKHFRDLALLSGGERALTAISLLFALYLVKPSPFCILDEIDAPLDDANVERFTRVISEFSKKTQFIIVTHNKMTMRAAKTLYGVTMEEEGVSKIVSVKFDDDANGGEA